MAEKRVGNVIYFQPEVSVGAVINYQRELHAVVQPSFWGFHFRLMPVKYTGHGKQYARTGERFWIRKSLVADAEVVEESCSITI